MAELSRLKPAPVPPIHPVPEHMADYALASVYARTKAGFGVPWMGVVAMAFAHYPRFYDCLWAGLEPMLHSAAFANACNALRASAEREAARLEPASILPRLRAVGYEPAEIAEICACNEVFSAGNMPYLLMAALARLLLEGCDWQAQPGVGPSAQVPPGGPKPPLIEAHHADPTMAALYGDIRATLGLPFVNTDYRAFARWPTYFAPAWADLRSAVRAPAYEACVARVHHRSVSLASALPNIKGLTTAMLQEAAAQDAPLNEVLGVVRLFQWLLPGLAVNVAYLRAQLLEPLP